MIHADAWMRGGTTGFYVRERMRGELPTIRDAYIFDEDGRGGPNSCPIEQDWRTCIQGVAKPGRADEGVSRCTARIDLRRIPAWRPSPDSVEKRRVAREVRREIEAAWGEADRIVVRDSNLEG